MITVLLTGGLGYIGSHIAVELIEKNYNVVIIDNLINSKIEKLDNLKKSILSTNNNSFVFVKMDMLNINELDLLFSSNKIDIVIHLAGLKSVGESILNPMLYYENNIVSTINLIKIMEKYKCYNLIFSSSATVYGAKGEAPYKESAETGRYILNPYGKTKQMQEEMLKDLNNSNPLWNVILLRYFNPISQKNTLLKEEPNGIPNNLFPYLVKVHNGELPVLNIFGNDYNTKDGTCIRDFIHVVDLALGHVAACDYINNHKQIGLKIYNLGTGNGISVKELVETFEKINFTKLNYKYVERRGGDLDISYANCSKAELELNWKCVKTIEDMVKL